MVKLGVVVANQEGVVSVEHLLAQDAELVVYDAALVRELDLRVVEGLVFLEKGLLLGEPFFLLLLAGVCQGLLLFGIVALFVDHFFHVLTLLFHD